MGSSQSKSCACDAYHDATADSSASCHTCYLCISNGTARGKAVPNRAYFRMQREEECEFRGKESLDLQSAKWNRHRKSIALFGSKRKASWCA